MRSHHSTWIPARAHGTRDCHQDNKLEILLYIQRKENLNREGKKLKLTRKSSFDVLFVLFYFSVEKYFTSVLEIQ